MVIRARPASPISLASIGLISTFAIALLAELYLFAATASIYDGYQPGISNFRTTFHPFILLAVVAGGPLLLALFWRENRATFAGFSRRVSLVAFVLCVVAFALIESLGVSGVVLCTVPAPSVRQLETTLRHSLGCPTFSGRSTGIALYTGLLSALLFWASRRMLRGI